MKQKVCVYCGSATPSDKDIVDAAHETGRLIGAQGYDMVYGGGCSGLMGIVADAALEAGASVTGIIPDHLRQREVQHTSINELLVVDSMHTRKQAMVARSDAFVILPGGWGTLDEAFEILTWKQLGLHDKPIGFLNVKHYWDPLLALLDHQIATGFVKPVWGHAYTVATTPAEAIKQVAQALKAAA